MQLSGWILPNGNNGGIIMADNNKWADEQPPYSTVPQGTTLTNVTHGTGPNALVDVFDSHPNFAICQSVPPGEVPIDDELAIPLENCPRCPAVSGELFNNKIMNDAFQDALGKQLDTSNVDNLLTSFNMFYEIINTSSIYDDAPTNWQTDFAYNKLKELFGLCIQNERILKDNNEYIQRMFDITKRMIELAKQEDSDEREFYFSTDLAGLQRLLDLRLEALYTLERMAPCLEITSEQSNYLGSMIAVITAEQLLLNGAISVSEFDAYAGIADGNRTFKKYGNSQANIDSILPHSVLPVNLINSQSAIDQAGFLYQISSSSDSSSVNFHLKKLNPNNTLVWEQVYDGLNGGPDSAKSIVIDDNNFIGIGV